MNKKVVVIGGGTGVSTLLKGLKLYPLDISAIVSVSDDGRSTGRLREEFNMPAVGDIRQVIVSLAETEPLVEQLLNYRFNTTSDLDGHTVGNLILTALSNITGNMSDGIEALSKVFNLKGKVLPLTEDNAKLMAKMTDNTIVEGEHNISDAHKKIKKLYYKEKVKVNENSIKAIREADLIILSMGSLYTSILPNLICKEIIEEIDKSKAPIVYICNMVTQPGETDNFNVSDHIEILNKYLGKRKINIVIANSGKITNSILKKYRTLEQKDAVLFDKDKLSNFKIDIIDDNFVTITDDKIRHNVSKLAFHIFSLTIDK